MVATMTWDPQYGQFGGRRLRPALELLARVQHDAPAVVHDIGCGRGEMTRVMAQRWPDAEIIGSDLSGEMLSEARQGCGRVDWLQIDLTDWHPEPVHDVLYANAALHWIPDHREALPRLVGGLRPGGVLAIQMPLSWEQPSHAVFRTVLAETAPDRTDLQAFYARNWVETPETYREILRGSFDELDIWRTTYQQDLTGRDPVLEWVNGSLLRPVIEALEPAEYERFENVYKAQLAATYQPNSDGTTTFPFSRLFIVASNRNS